MLIFYCCQCHCFSLQCDLTPNCVVLHTRRHPSSRSFLRASCVSDQRLLCVLFYRVSPCVDRSCSSRRVDILHLLCSACLAGRPSTGAQIRSSRLACTGSELVATHMVTVTPPDFIFREHPRAKHAPNISIADRHTQVDHRCPSTVLHPPIVLQI